MWADLAFPDDAIKSASLELQLISSFVYPRLLQIYYWQKGCFLTWFDLLPISFEESRATPITLVNFQMVNFLT